MQWLGLVLMDMYAQPEALNKLLAMRSVLRTTSVWAGFRANVQMVPSLMERELVLKTNVFGVLQAGCVLTITAANRNVQLVQFVLLVSLTSITIL